MACRVSDCAIRICEASGRTKWVLMWDRVGSGLVTRINHGGSQLKSPARKNITRGELMYSLKVESGVHLLV